MKIGCVYSRRPEKWPKWQWVADALLQLGHETISVHDAAHLMAADQDCDIMLFEHRDCGVGWRYVRDNAPRRTSVWVQWWFDLVAVIPGRALADQPEFRLSGEAMRLFDHVFVKERAMLDEYRSLGVNASYLDQGCPSWWPACEHRQAPRWDVLVFGSATAQYAERKEAVRRLVSDGYSVAWATDSGSVPPVVERLPWQPPRKLPELMSDARCVLCVDVRSDVDGYVSDRNWLVTGAGAIPLMRGCGGYGGYRDAAEMICTMQHERRSTIGRSLRARTMGANTYEHRLQKLLSVVCGSGGSADGEAPLPCVQGDQASDGG